MVKHKDYGEIRLDVEKTLKKRLESQREMVKVIIPYSICSIAAGADEVLESIQNIIKELDIKSVILETTGCIGLCSAEPIITVCAPGMPKVSYKLVTPEKARAIILCHAVGRRIIRDWILN